MACQYYKSDGTAYNSVQEMIEDFYKSNNQLKNAAIFSADEIQESTVNKILSIKGAASYEKSKSVSVTEFITSSHPEIFRDIPGLKATQLLAPEVREDERAYRYVLNNIDNVGLVNTNELDYDRELFDFVKIKPEFENAEDGKIIYLLNKLKEIMDHEEKTKNFGILLHDLISKKLLNNESGYRSAFKTFFENSKNKDIFGEYSKSEWKSKIDTIVNTVVDKVTNIGTPISEIFINSEGPTRIKGKIDLIAVDTNGPTRIKGKIDLIAVDTNGDAHIFEIKISKTDYKNWDSAKKLTLD